LAAARRRRARPWGCVGPGTGLGVSGLVFAPDGTDIPLAGEGGHATLAAQTPLEWELLRILQRRYGHVSAERVLSGQGLVDLYHALRERLTLGGRDVSQAAHVTALALEEGDALALQALELFCGFLGTVAGDLALTLGARGGVYLGGGIVPRLGAWFEQSGFRARFEAKGRVSGVPGAHSVLGHQPRRGPGAVRRGARARSAAAVLAIHIILAVCADAASAGC